jgi:hypothetical protein
LPGVIEDPGALHAAIDRARTPRPAFAAVRNGVAPKEVWAGITAMVRAAHVPGLSITMVRANRLLFANASGR